MGDAGASDLGETLASKCHVALYGLHFDFNRATLQLGSGPLLDRIAALLREQPALKIEVQGHTDNVGSDAYNQTLSEARAETVLKALVARGTAPARLTARRYGKSTPIADNDTPEGRAKNRRVELVNVNCQKPGGGNPR